MYVRSPNIAAYWSGEDLLLHEFRLGVHVLAKPIVIDLLDAFSRPRAPREVSRSFKGYTAASVEREIRTLQQLGLLSRVGAQKSTIDIAGAWNGARAAAYYHFATRDVPFLVRDADLRRYTRNLLAGEPQPRLYKSYPTRPRRLLSARTQVEAFLYETLLRRRTVRRFRRSPVPLEDFAAVTQGTWGQQGWLDAGVFGKLVRKTSPSAGARHPIECYVVAWNIRGLAPGLYHYGVQDNVLELLKKGDFRKTAVRIASGLSWIGKAAFLCIMTAVAERVYWKYRSSKAYSVFLLDAGHLGQTFLLLMASLELGGFTTAAIQHSIAESFLGLDGVREFPIYLCGGGLPAKGDPERPTDL